jgi:hypothetical protein
LLIGLVSTWPIWLALLVIVLVIRWLRQKKNGKVDREA